MHEELEQAPIDSHSVFRNREMRRWQEAEVVKASQPVRAHSSAGIAILALALEQVLGAEQELVPEALAWLPVQVRMHEAEEVAALALALVLEKRREVGVGAS
jgi:hypothetical protein